MKDMAVTATATGTLNLPIIDLSSPHRLSTASSIRQACVEYGFFYLVNHGIDEDFLPSQELLPNWRPRMESFFWKLMSVGEKLLSLIALSLNLDENYFAKISALNKHESFLRLLRYPGELGSNEEICGASAHSDYGMITLLLTNGVPGLQICKDKLKQPRVWEDVPHVEGAMIVNIGDMMERWTNCLYQSALHRVMPTGKERYSVAFFMDPPSDCVVECFESCCSESSPPRFPPIRSEDYLNEKFKLTYDSERDLQCSI